MQRIEETPGLAPYRQVFLDDWPAAEELWAWAFQAPVAELRDWAELLQETLQ